MNREVLRQARFVEAIAGSITEWSWADDVLARCAQMREAIAEIEREARKREGGER